MPRMRLAACGIDCNECDIYNAAHDRQAAEALVKWFKSRGWIEERADAQTVMAKAPYCQGCWNKTGVHWCGDCHLLSCCEGKRLDHCGECADFPCQEYKAWIKDYEHHKRAMEPTFRTLEPHEKIVFAQQGFVRISRTVLYPNIGGRISAGLSQTPRRS